MKRTLLTKTMLLLFALIAGSTSTWALTKTEGFEGKATTTNYQGTVTVSTSESDCGIAWEIYYGTVSTNDKISGTRSAQMRWYASTTGNIPYTKTTTPIDGLSNVALKARTSNLNVKLDVCYSADGETWTVGKTYTFTATGKGEDVSLDIPSGNKYVKFEVSSSSTAPSSGNCKLIVDDVVFTYSSSLETPTWSLDPASASVVQGSNTTLQLTTNYDGTLNFISNNTDVATVSYNASTKVITVTGVGAGTTTITATGAATATYEAISKNIDVTVTYPELASNATDVMGPLGYSYFGLTLEGENTYAQPEEDSRTKTDAYGVTLLFEKGESSTYLRYDGNYMRFYNKNTLTITAPTGSTIRKVVFTEPSTNKGWDGSMTADKGVYVSSVKTWFATAEDVTSVVLTNDATKRIGGIEVYLMATSLPVTIASSGYSSLATLCPLDFAKATPAGLEAYVVPSVTASAVSLSAVSQAPASTGVILKGTAGTTYTIPVISSAEAVGTNKLQAAVTAYNCAANEVYILKGGKFCRVTKASTVPAGKAYLLASDVPASASELTFDFEGGATGVAEVRGQKEEVRGEFYDLQGRKVANPTKGLYIVNGKKVIIK